MCDKTDINTKEDTGSEGSWESSQHSENPLVTSIPLSELDKFLKDKLNNIHLFNILSKEIGENWRSINIKIKK